MLTNDDNKYQAIFKAGLIKFLRHRAEQRRKRADADKYLQIDFGILLLPADDQIWRPLKRGVFEDVNIAMKTLYKDVRNMLQEEPVFDAFVKKHKFSEELVWIDYKQHGPVCWSIMMKLVEGGGIDDYWDVLQLILLRMPSVAAYKLLRGEDESWPSLQSYKPETLDKLAQMIVEGSRFPIADCLKVADFFAHKAEIHVADAEGYEEKQEKYTQAALDLLERIESDHGASMLLETCSDGAAPLEGKSVLDVAIETDNVNFIAHSRIMRIVNAMWWDFHYMDPHKCQYANNVPALSEQLMAPQKFFKTAAGKFWVSAILFIIYCFFFTWVTLKKDCVYVDASPLELIFWTFSISFVLQETQQLIDKGVAGYFSSGSNMLDFGCCMLFTALGGIRFNATEFKIGGCEFFEGPTYIQVQQADGTFATVIDITQPTECYDDCFAEPTVIEHWKSVAFMTFWSFAIILMWMRFFLLFKIHPSIGPLIKMVGQMFGDIINFIIIMFVFFFGFMLCFFYFVGDLVKPFYKFSTCTLTVFEATNGAVEWDSIFGTRVPDVNYVDWGAMTLGGPEPEETDDGAIYGNGYLPELGILRMKTGRIFLCIYLIIGFIVMFNLLIAMMAETYNEVQEQARQAYSFGLADEVYDFHTSSTVLPAPLNILVFAAYAPVYFVRVVDCSAIKELTQKMKRGGVAEEGKRWICGFCHHRNMEEDTEEVRSRWLSTLEEEEKIQKKDAELLNRKGTMLCANCQRVRREITSGKKSMEGISILIYFVAIFPVLAVILGLIPGLINYSIGHLQNKVEEVRSVTGGKDDEDDKHMTKEQKEEQMKEYEYQLEMQNLEGVDPQAKEIQHIFKELGGVRTEEMLARLEEIDEKLRSIQDRLKRNERRRRLAQPRRTATRVGGDDGHE